MDIFFEDKHDNAVMIHEECNIPVILFNTPYNQEPIPNGVIRVNNWKQAYIWVENWVKNNEDSRMGELQIGGKFTKKSLSYEQAFFNLYIPDSGRKFQIYARKYHILLNPHLKLSLDKFQFLLSFRNPDR